MASEREKYLCLKDKTVLITGGNGCLGRFLVDLLLKYHPEIAVIRIFDKLPSGKAYFQKESDDLSSGDGAPRTQIQYVEGDLRNIIALHSVVSGAHCVFHLAGVVDVSLFPNENLMWAVNCRGTQDIVEACYESSVECLVYTSSVCAIQGPAPLHDVCEADCQKPETWLWNGYGETKWYAERCVIDANDLPLPNQKRLHTVCLRPTQFYGENDMLIVPPILKTAKLAGGKFQQVGKEDVKMQQTYVGNVAWAHVLAMEQLVLRPEKCGGETYFITDNTPMDNPAQFMQPFLEDFGMGVSGFSIPYLVFYWIVRLIVFFLSFLKRFCKEPTVLNSWVPVTLVQAAFLSMKNSFSRRKAEETLGYAPLFSYEESVRRSRAFYSKINLSVPLKIAQSTD